MWASLGAQQVNNLSAMRETWVRFLGQEDSPGEEKPRGKPIYAIYTRSSLVAQSVKNLPGEGNSYQL